MSHLLYLIAEKEDLSEMEHYLSICSQKTTITSYLCSCCSGIIGTDTHLRKTWTAEQKKPDIFQDNKLVET